MRSLALALLCSLACACQSTSFQTPPLEAAAACDPALPGHWVSLNDQGRPDGEMRLEIGAGCELAVTDRHRGNLRQGEATVLYTGASGRLRYAWVSAGWADQRFAAEDGLGTNPDDIYLFRYLVHGNALDVEFVDHKAVAHHIIDGRIPGTVRSDDKALVNRITGGARPEVLALPDLFSADTTRFRRETGSP